MNHILFPITYECNLSCAGCCAKSSEKVNIEACISNIKEKIGEIEWVYVTGGEPFTVASLFEVCDTLKEYGFKVGVTTNGTFYYSGIRKCRF